MKTLVAGGAGFIGSHLCDVLLEKNYEVVCIDNFSRGKFENIEHLEKNEKFKLYKIDLREIEQLKELFENENIDCVFHLVANSDIQVSAKNPIIEYESTYTTTFNLLECMREKNIKKMFFASTSAVYGDKENTILDENTPNLSPVSYYGAAKLGSEALISAYSFMNDMDILIFRFPNVIGPRLTHGVIYDFIRKLEKNPKKLEILGDGKQTKPYIYVRDLVSAIVDMMSRKYTGVELYNLGVENATSVTRIADIICEEMGLKNVRYNYTGGKVGWKGDVPRFQYSLEKIYKTGWRAVYDSDEAVRMTVKSELRKR